MKLFRKTAAAITAFTMIASASAVFLPAADVFTSSEVYADDAASYGYSASVSDESYDIASLKTLAYYQKNELYRDDVPVEKAASLEGNYIAEVKVNIDKNSGFYLGQIRLEFDEALTFIGCKNYQKDGKPTVSNFETIEDNPVAVSGDYKRIIITLKDKSNVTETGELFTLLFALPEKPETGKSYKVSLSEKTKFIPWDKTDINQNVSLKSGSITLKGTDPTVTPTDKPTVTPTDTPTDKPTVTPTDTPTDKPTVTPTDTPTDKPTVTPTDKPTVNPTVTPTDKPTETPASSTPSPEIDYSSLTNPLKLPEGASIDIDAPAVTAAKGTKQVELKVNLKDFDSKTEAFDYAILGIDLPDGFTVAELRKNDNTPGVHKMDALKAAAIETKTDFKSKTGDYYAIEGIDSSKFGKNDGFITVTVNVPENAEGAYDVSIASIYGRKVDNKILLIDNGEGEKIYSSAKATVTVGEAAKSDILKGDFNLDGKVSQIDATFMLRYLLESSLSNDKAGVLYDLIKGSIREDLKNESKDKIFELANASADVDGSESGKSFKQTDATYILRALLTGSKIENNSFWETFFK
ncbi:hypothetical protein [Ruminococcus sp. HUN007]|uniref:hypothetical protein n=1 Tax=Ruminococcus sp. HUN007 TaxID=1514668 RepID=UPI0005D16BE1|nr:hypothetical protein [Ruminococcus sp. HUN007]